MAKDGYSIGTPIEMDKTGQFGDYFGGVIGTIFSGAAFWLLYLTLKHQTETEIKSDINAQLSRMLQINQQNIQGMRYDASRLLPNTDTLYIEPRDYVGKDIFQIVYYQFITCRNELMPILSKKDKIFKKEYADYLSSLPVIKERNIDIYFLARIDIAYSIVFFGVGSEGKSILRGLFKERYKDAIVEKVIKYISLKPAFDETVNAKWSVIESLTPPRNLIDHVNDIYNWRKFQTHVGYTALYPDLSVGFRSNYVKYYRGFHQLLGHYFRHFYQIVKFIDRNGSLTPDDKKRMVKSITGQMSNYEQIVFFINSLSSLGRNWEIEPQSTPIKGEHWDLITHYRLIKNIPSEMLFGIPVSKFYPDIEYELFK